jgi:hypothetical protein
MEMIVFASGSKSIGELPPVAPREGDRPQAPFTEARLELSDELHHTLVHLSQVAAVRELGDDLLLLIDHHTVEAHRPGIDACPVSFFVIRICGRHSPLTHSAAMRTKENPDSCLRKTLAPVLMPPSALR